MAREQRVPVSGTWTDDEIDGEATCLVTPGERGTPRTMDGPGTPDWGPEVEILSVVSDDGRDLMPLLSQKELDWIENHAADQAGEDDCDDAYDAAEARWEARNER